MKPLTSSIDNPIDAVLVSFMPLKDIEVTPAEASAQPMKNMPAPLMTIRLLKKM